MALYNSVGVRLSLGWGSRRAGFGWVWIRFGQTWVGLRSELGRVGSDLGRTSVGVGSELGRAWVEVGSEYEFDPPTGEIIVLVLNPYITHRRAGEGSISNFSPMIK